MFLVWITQLFLDLPQQDRVNPLSSELLSELSFKAQSHSHHQKWRHALPK